MAVPHPATFRPWRLRESPIVRLSAATLVVLATLYPRLSLLGGFPATDEGIYAFAALLIHNNLAAGKGLPAYEMLHLYPALLSWVYSLDWNHLLLFRALDMVVAICAGWLLFRVCAQESGSWVSGAVIAAAFCFAMNQHPFVQHGFKNSIFAAYVPLFVAARIGLDRTRSDDLRWYICGGLVAIAVFLRETFVSFAALGAVAVLVGHGWKQSGRYVASGIATALVLGGTLLFLRGGIASLLSAYVDLAAAYQSVANERWESLARAVKVSWREAGFVVPLALGALASIAVCRFRGRIEEAGRFAFWVSAATVPLLEPMAKIGFPYHISVCLPGLCGLCAFGWRSLVGARVAVRLLLAGIVLVPVLFMAWPQFGKLNHFFRSRAIPDVAAIRDQSWPKASIERSNYLLLAEAIRRSAPGTSATLSSSARMLVLFPLTGLVPSAYGLEDLSQIAHRVGGDASSLRAVIRECPPDVIMLSTRAGTPPVIAEAVAGMPEYAEVAQVPIALDRDYGGFGGIIYKRSRAAGPCRRIP